MSNTFRLINKSQASLSSSLTGRDEEGDPGDDDEHARGKVVRDDVVRDLALQRQLEPRHRKSTWDGNMKHFTG